MKKVFAVSLLLLGITFGIIEANETAVIAYDDLPGPHAIYANGN
ncbi:hypothetical protein [Tumebacillus avium]|nr:hypothetical protein [Tumebacillus avium]